MIARGLRPARPQLGKTPAIPEKMAARRFDLVPGHAYDHPIQIIGRVPVLGPVLFPGNKRKRGIMHLRRVLALCVALTFFTSAVPMLAQQRIDTSKQPKRSKQEQQDIDTLLKAVDTAAAGQTVTSDIPVTWESNHFVKGQGGITYIPFTLTVDRSKLSSADAAVYVRVVNKGQAAPAPAPAADSKDNKNNKAPAARVAYPWDNINFVEVPSSGKVARAMQLPAGDYEVFIAVKDKGVEQKDQKNAPPAKVGLLHRDLTVPDFNKAELSTSSIILARSVEPMTTALKPEQQQENPYVFGPMRIVPSEDGKFPKSAELNVVFWIYGAGDAAGGKPDVQVDFNFYQKQAGSEKYFNKTAPQVLNATTLPPEFSVAAGHQLPGSLVVPLATFPEGDYRLEVKVTDKPSGKTLTENINFSVAAS